MSESDIIRKVKLMREMQRMPIHRSRCARIQLPEYRDIMIILNRHNDTRPGKDIYSACPGLYFA